MPDFVRKINRGIIDVHVQFHNHVFDSMAIYKWTPIVLYTLIRLGRIRSPSMIFPLIWVYVFDWYFY
jgi:hypothetical protein